MHFSVMVKLVEDETSRPLPGVQLCLYDRDRITRDDLLGTEVTDSNGEACFRFDEDKYMDIDDRLGGDFPDLYAVVCRADGEKVHTTRTEATHNIAPRHMTVRIPRHVAEKNQLLASAG